MFVEWTNKKVTEGLKKVNNQAIHYPKDAKNSKKC